LVERRDDTVVPLPALARFYLGEPTIRTPAARRDEATLLFADTQLEPTS
jgi:hypothetical protein